MKKPIFIEFLKCVYIIPYTYIGSYLNTVTVANVVMIIFPQLQGFSNPQPQTKLCSEAPEPFSASRFQVRRPSSGGVSLWFFKCFRGVSQHDVHQKLVDFGRKGMHLESP